MTKTERMLYNRLEQIARDCAAAQAALQAGHLRRADRAVDKVHYHCGEVDDLWREVMRDADAEE